MIDLFVVAAENTAEELWICYFQQILFTVSFSIKLMWTTMQTGIHCTLDSIVCLILIKVLSV